MEINPHMSSERSVEAKKKKNMEVGSSSHASFEEPHSGPSTGAIVPGMTLVTRIKTLKKDRVQDSDSNADKD